MPGGGGAGSARGWTRRHDPVWAGRSGAEDAAGGLRPLAPDAPPLPLGQPSPDAELLAVLQRELQALLAHDAPAADLLGLTRGGAALREEQIGVDPQAVGVVL